VLKNSSLVPDAHNPKTSQNMQAAATDLKFVKSKNSDEKKKNPDREYDGDGSYLSLSLSVFARRARASISVVYFSSFCCCSVLRAWPRALAPGASSSRTYAERRKETLILRTFQPTILFSYLPVLRNRCRWIPTYLPTYLPTYRPFFPTPDVSIGYQRKEICAIRKKKGRSFCLLLFFFVNSATIVGKWVPFLPWVKERKAKEKTRKEKKRKEKEKEFCSESIILFHPFSVFFFSSLFFYFKRPLKKKSYC
jgi:hypothetical protein